MTQRKEIPVKHNPGITKIYRYESRTKQWVDTGKYRSVRRVMENGCSLRVSAVFDNIEDAKAYRAGKIECYSEGFNIHRNAIYSQYTFANLIEEWKPIHYLKVEFSTQQTYDKLLPHFDYLKKIKVRDINTSVVDELVKYWASPDYPRCSRRATFEKELDLLKTILNYYRSRKNSNFVIPILPEHYLAGDIAKLAQKPVQSLSQSELAQFLEALKTGKYANYYHLALTQFSMGLRIGEACGLTWDVLDLEKEVARIEKTITWDLWTWEPREKRRPKNGKIRLLRMPPFLIRELRELKCNKKSNVHLVFHDGGRPLNRNFINRA